MAEESQSTTDEPQNDRRRRFLGAALLTSLGAIGLAGAWRRSGGKEPPSPPGNQTVVAGDTDDGPADDQDLERVRRYAPDLYFGALEKWFPTDPGQYLVETADGAVVDGFTALEEYSLALSDSGRPPAPTVFYHITEAADGVDAIQYWMYSVFDQFTVNFHWHDWELVQVFVDRDSGEPRLVSASAHSRSVPNNEFFEPSLEEGRRPGILAEVGSHSSATELNDVIPSFERLSADDWHSDVTNDALDIIGQLVAPLAYGLPRDEGARLPFVMPALGDDRLDELADLAIDREHFIDERATVSSWLGLPRPPSDLPVREPGIVMASQDSETAADVRYELRPIDAISEEITGFAGPQLSFDFAVPGFIENQIDHHITSVGIPWEQPRFDTPLDDVTDPLHRREIDGQTPSGLVNRVVGRISQLGTGGSGSLPAVDEDGLSAVRDIASVSRFSLPVEVVVRLSSSDPVASVTRSGVYSFLHVDRGSHQLTINGPGYEPLAVGFEHDGGTFRPGTDGSLTVVASEDAGWLRGDGRSTTGIDYVRVIEDYAGILYAGQPIEDDRFAIPVHRDGHYTVAVTDDTGVSGAYRVRPSDFGDDGSHRIESVRTGKTSLTTALQGELEDLVTLAETLAERDDARFTVVELLMDAENTLDINSDEDVTGERLDRLLATAGERLASARKTLTTDEQDGYADASVPVLRPRIERTREQTQRAMDTPV